MAWEFHVLVVANVTATSDELLSTLSARARQGACRFTLVMPRSTADAGERLGRAVDAMRAAGLGKVDGRVGDPDPVVATMEAWDPMQFDEVVVSTLPTGVSRWLGLDLPRRLQKLTGVTVRHVVAEPQRDLRGERPPEHDDYGMLSPLAAALMRR
jgi:GABA permease